jgi:hypothetical protein
MINNIGIVPTLFDGFSDAAVVQGFEASFEHTKVTAKKERIVEYKSLILTLSICTVIHKHFHVYNYCLIL